MPIRREVQVYCSSTHEALEVYPSASEAALAYGMCRHTVSSRCRGEINQPSEKSWAKSIHYIFKYTGRITPAKPKGKT